MPSGEFDVDMRRRQCACGQSLASNNRSEGRSATLYYCLFLLPVHEGSDKNAPSREGIEKDHDKLCSEIMLPAKAEAAPGDHDVRWHCDGNIAKASALSKS